MRPKTYEFSREKRPKQSCLLLMLGLAVDIKKGKSRRNAPKGHSKGKGGKIFNRFSSYCVLEINDF